MLCAVALSRKARGVYRIKHSMGVRVFTDSLTTAGLSMRQLLFRRHSTVQRGLLAICLEVNPRLIMNVIFFEATTNRAPPAERTALAWMPLTLCAWLIKQEIRQHLTAGANSNSSQDPGRLLQGHLPRP